MKDSTIIIIGGGPAGLTAAYELTKAGKKALVFEKDDDLGGISRTVDYRGYHFDLGGHRFFTKVKRVDAFWREVLDDEFLHRSRLSRIYYNKRFFYYPLKPFNTLAGLGVVQSGLILLSYAKSHLFPHRDEETFEHWVTNRFGYRLYNTFFKTYTEKVWGMPCSEIRAEWAAQRIKGLSLVSAIRNALMAEKKARGAGRGGKNVIKTLIESFDYPKLGPGMMWRTVAARAIERGGEVRKNAEVVGIHWGDGRIKAVEIKENGVKRLVEGEHFISSMPIRELVERLDPRPPGAVLKAGRGLKYRDFLTVALVVNNGELFPDNWIYVHDPDVRLGRVQNFKNWSPYMVPDQSKTCLGLEYFCFEGDELWNAPDEELIALGKKEIETLGLASASDVEDGKVVRVPKAYPVYDAEYRGHLDTVKEFLAGLPNLHLVGRNGMHKYNNQDHSMLTAMLAVENVMGASHDLWEVNEEKAYHEEVSAEAERATEAAIPDQVIIKAFSRLDNVALAGSAGAVAGLALFFMTLALVVKGGPQAGQTLKLLGVYFAGYDVTPVGALVGLGYGFLWGFIMGWLFSYLRNFFLGYYIYKIRKKTEMLSFRDFLDHF
jgi:protoporphyrinogen oxidase